MINKGYIPVRAPDYMARYRDLLASSVMNKLLEAHLRKENYISNAVAQAIAEQSYGMADEMLNVRNKKTTCEKCGHELEK